MPQCWIISIHSTTRVETNCVCQDRRAYTISIHSTTRVETLHHPHPILESRFQSTPPRGWRPLGILGQIPAPDFNPLHHEGGDAGVPLLPPRLPPISIHSTTRVETRGLVKIELAIGISIHSTTRVETAILHNNHYYSSTHFHKQIISHPLKSRPTIPAHSQIRSHCANFPVRISP